MSLFTDGLEFVGKNIASGAVSWVGGQAAGWVLGDLFGTNGPTTQDVLNAIGNLGKQLTNIQGTLATIEKQLTSEFAAIEAALAAIHQEELYIAWQQVDNHIVTYKTQINTQYGTFVEYANAAPVKKPSHQQITALVTQIQDTNVGAKVSLTGISSFVTGDDEAKGALELWREMVTPLIAAGQMTFGQASTSYMNYYMSILHAQMRAINLIVESYNQQNSNNISQEEYNNYRSLLVNQEDSFLRALEELTYDTLQPNVSYTPNSAIFEYFGLVQGLFAGGGWVATYAPTPWRLAAEGMLAAAQAMQPSERRIVVWMTYDNYFGLHPFQDFSQMQIPIVLQSDSAAAGSTPIQPDSTTTLISGPPQYKLTMQLPDNQHLVRRNVFTKAITADGFYQLSDMNNAYPPQAGSNQTLNYFMDPATYLSYYMRVDAQQQFDFMDFALYVDPNSDAGIPAI